ncbi:MAG: ABC transporter ATP-binding protein [Candidatus Cohnella colombiensis]|uniref:ABC transporter ATP-binding protein n=1 Tax=Candidatus Cohnella colombiensis TaxID=3121368 RepID=A0AA95JBS3_9BACL|nr:MAG: ABC transporter ATP-binding protein [Cohnella sp.]
MGATSREVVMSVQGLKKNIGRKPIIRQVSFDVYAGEIFGFLGPNGSGKTTTIRMLVDLIKPSEGRIVVCGDDIAKHPERALSHIGCIVENPEMYTYMTGWENLEHFARMQSGISTERITEVVGIVGLDQRIHDKVKSYSLGMRQRLGIAQALLCDPKLLILDEPTNGLDPKGIKELREFIRMLSASGMSLFISSHLLSEIQLMCDRVAIIAHGEVIAVGEVDELVAQAGTYTVWQFDQPEEAIKQFAGNADLQLLSDGEYQIDEALLTNLDHPIVTIMEEDQIPFWVNKFVNAGLGIRSVQRIAPSLEQLFLKLTEGEKID